MQHQYFSTLSSNQHRKFLSNPLKGFFSCCSIPFYQTHSYSTDKIPDQELLQLNSFSKNWISLLHDNNYVSILNIPGTHQSLALVGGPGVTVAQCQTWNLKNQLRCGIRYLDIRIKRTRDQKMPIYHGVVFQNKFFEKDVFLVIKEFLLENPSEFIIMNVKAEGTAETGSPSLEDILQPFINLHQDFMYQSNGNIPLVKDLRGKVWILPYYNWNLNGFSLEKLKLADVLHHQDAFEASILDKKRQIIDHYVRAFLNKDLRSRGQKLFINNINAVKWYKWPSEYAKILNQFVFEKCYFEGIVALDFPGESLIMEIIKSNFPIDYFKMIEQ